MKLTALIPAILFSAASTFASAAGPVIIDLDSANAPFMSAKDGKAVGIYPAIIQAAFKHMNVAVTLQPEPWKRALEETDNGKAGIGGVYKNADREKKYDFSDKLFTEKIQVFYSKTAPVAFSGLDDLKGKKVGVIRGWSYGDDFDNARKAGAVIAEDGDSDEGNIRKLDAGHLDVVIAVAESGAAIMAKDKNVGVVATPLTQNPTYIAFAKTANMKALLHQFDQALKEMQKTGELKSAVSAALGK
jgi:polar amino acid transport system substrate-binding protein